MMGRWLALAGRELLAEADALVPVPLHWRRNWARRFNQSGILAAAVSFQTGVPIAASALKRVKATVQQVGLSRTERAANMQGAFRVPPEEARPGRRRLDLGRDRRGLCESAASRRRRQGRRAGICQGCRSGANVHIQYRRGRINALL